MSFVWANSVRKRYVIRFSPSEQLLGCTVTNFMIMAENDLKSRHITQASAVVYMWIVDLSYANMRVL